MYCSDCDINVATQGPCCPLCGSILQPATPSPAKPGATPAATNPYPNLSGLTRQYNFIVRLLLFLSLLGGGICLLVNLLVPSKFFWSAIVIAALIYLWVTIPPLLRRGANFAKRTVLQVLFTSALMVLLDWLLGYSGWSVNYVIPGLLCGGIGSVGALAIFNRTNFAQYVYYQVLMGIFAFIPLVLYLTGASKNLVMVLVTAALGLASLLITIIFGDRTLKSDFRRRFHL